MLFMRMAADQEDGVADGHTYDEDANDIANNGDANDYAKAAAGAQSEQHPIFMIKATSKMQPQCTLETA